jgi:hypothetical protein
MTELSNYGVTELDVRQAEETNGGSDFTYGIGYTIDKMVFHPEQAIDTALQYYFG